jgi:FtsH-binding integral membrane protein
VSDAWRGSGVWIARAATVMLIVASSVRFFGGSSASDTAATWIYVLALAVGLIGIAVAVVARRRKPAPTTDANDTDAA